MKPEAPFNFSPFKARRKHIAKALKEGVLVIPTAAESTRNGNVTYPFRFDSHFYYLSGFKEPEAVLVIVLGKNPREILFCRNKDVEREIWDGFRFGPEMAKAAFGFDEAYPIESLKEKLPELLANQTAIHTCMGLYPWWDQTITDALNNVRTQVRSGISAPTELCEVRAVASQMRLIKDKFEIALMRKSAQIGSLAHQRAMRFTREGAMEYQVEAEILHEFKMNGAQEPAYGSIVAGGANACILHYQANNQRLQNGDLLLIDAGCELEGYASDITRTFPVNGKFSGPQKAIYELVLASQLASMAKVKPSAKFTDYHDEATRVLAQGFKDLKLCKGSLDSIIESGSYKQFYMHRAGHWLGLDVHDAGNYMEGGKWVKLLPGMVVTVEPGCYIRPAANVPERFWNIGVRIEDDVLVTVKGHENLSASCPKTIADVEAACAK